MHLLKQNNLRIGIITNGPSDYQRLKIKSLNPRDWIADSDIFVSGDYLFSKPDIRIFEQEEQVLKMDKEDIWYDGDSYHNDVIDDKKKFYYAVLPNFVKFLLQHTSFIYCSWLIGQMII